MLEMLEYSHYQVRWVDFFVLNTIQKNKIRGVEIEPEDVAI